MELLSTAFVPDGEIPAAYTCDGDGGNPPLSIRGVPSTAKSLALIVDDPDAPNGTFVHWVMWNIPAATSEIAGGSVPAGAQEGASSLGKPGYVPACPPNGMHHYHFKLFALDASLELPAATTSQELEHAMEGRILARAALVGVYRRT
jgi:Raf kinase inhibitor-like YbhB/YbcL family protein